MNRPGGSRLGMATLLVAPATALAGVANYATNAWLAHALTLEAFGDAALIVSSLLLLSAIATAVQLAAAHRRVQDEPDRLRSLRRRVGGIAAVAAVVMVASAGPLAAGLHSTSPGSFAILGLSVPVYLAMSIDRGVMQGEQRFADLAASLIVESVGRLVVTGLAMAWLDGPTAAAVGMASSFVLTAGHARLRPGVAVCAEATASARQVAVGLPLVLLLFSQVLIANGDVVVVSATAPGTASVFAAVALLGRISFPLAWAIVMVAFPKLADPAQAGRVARTTTLLVGGIGVAATLATWLGGPLAARTLFGADAARIAPFLVPYAVATGAFALACLGAVTDGARGRNRGAAVLLVAGVAQTVLVAVAAPHGVGPAVWAQVVVMGTAAVVGLPRGRVVAPGEGTRRRSTPARIPVA
ncbi:MAG: hypothetical protein ACK5RL_05260 [Acidimicrobiales bacterium]